MGGVQFLVDEEVTGHIDIIHDCGGAKMVVLVMVCPCISEMT